MHDFLSLDTGVRLGVYGKILFILNLVLTHLNSSLMILEKMTVSMTTEITQ